MKNSLRRIVIAIIPIIMAAVALGLTVGKPQTTFAAIAPVLETQRVESSKITFYNKEDYNKAEQSKEDFLIELENNDRGSEIAILLKDDWDAEENMQKYYGQNNVKNNNDAEIALEYLRSQTRNYYKNLRSQFAQKNNLEIDCDIPSPYIFINTDNSIRTVNDLEPRLYSAMQDEFVKSVKIFEEQNIDLKPMAMPPGVPSNYSYTFDDIIKQINHPGTDSVYKASSINIGVLEVGLINRTVKNKYIDLSDTTKVIPLENIVAPSASGNAIHAIAVTSLIRYLASDATIYTASLENSGYDALAIQDILKKFINKKVNVLNISLGDIDSKTDLDIKVAYQEMINDMINGLTQSQYVAVIAAAGNYKKPDYSHEVCIPANLSDVFAVGAANRDYNGVCDFSAYITDHIRPQIIAPGDYMYFPGLEFLYDNGVNPDVKSEYACGTSFAAPIVTAAAALLMGYNSDYKTRPKAVYARLMASANQEQLSGSYEMIPDTGFYKKAGAGLLDVTEMLRSSTNLKISNNKNELELNVTLNPGEEFIGAASWKSQAEGQFYRVHIYDNVELTSDDYDSARKVANIFYHDEDVRFSFKNNTNRIKTYEVNCNAYHTSAVIYLSWAIKSEYAINNLDVGVEICGFSRNFTGTTLNLPSKINGKNVVKISSEAFKNCSNLTNIYIPSSVQHIGLGAFQGCDNLESITIPFVGEKNEGLDNTHFGWIFGCPYLMPIMGLAQHPYIPSKLEQVVITGGQSIGSHAFMDCLDLKSVTIPSSIANIGTQAFQGCTNLSTINFNPTDMADLSVGAGFVSLGDGSEITVNIGANVTKIPAYLFHRASRVTTINFLGTACHTIGAYAFTSCNTVDPGGYITLPKGLITIGSYAFYNCGLMVNNIPNSVKTIGDYAFANNDLKTVFIPDSVETLGNGAFYNCNNLENVDFGENSTINFIGYHTFIYCSRLENIILPQNVTFIGASAFSECSNLKNIIIPRNVTDIGSSAFFNCTSLESIIIPKGVTLMGINVFSNCTKLTIFAESIAGPNGVPDGWDFFNSSSKRPVFWGCTLSQDKSYVISFVKTSTNISYPNASNGISAPYRKGYLFHGWSTYANGFGATYSLTNEAQFNVIPNGTTLWALWESPSPFNIQDNALIGYIPPQNFKGHVDIPDGVTTIGNGNPVFGQYASQVTSITIPETVTTISANAFAGIMSTEIVIPPSVTKIGSSAFSGCTSLTSVNIPKNVTSIGSSAFLGCSNLGTINYNAADCGNFSWSSHPFSGIGSNLSSVQVIIGSDVKRLPSYFLYNVTKITAISIPNNVTAIGNSAFSDCTSLTSVSIADSVTSIGDWTFSRCTSLTSVNLPNSITTINVGVFEDCTSLTNITIPSSVRTIGNAAFQRSGLTEVTIPNNVTSIGTWAFAETKLVNVVIPSSVTTIGGSAFFYCNALREIVIPNSVISMGSQVFFYCFYLTIYTARVNGSSWDPNWNSQNRPVYWSYTETSDANYGILNGVTTLIKYMGIASAFDFSSVNIAGTPVTSIGVRAFQNNLDLRTIVIPASVTNIGDYAFYRCLNIDVTFAVGSQLKTIGDFAFYCCINWQTNLIIPSSVISIGNDAFAGCNKIYNIEFEPNSQLKIIGNGAFSSVFELTGSFAIPYGVTTIGDAAFGFCYYVKSITIPTSVTYVGNNAFYYCHSLTVYVDAAVNTNTWNTNWNASNCPVFWSCTLSDDGSCYVESFIKTANSISNPYNISAPYRKNFVFDRWYANPSFTGTSYSATSITSAPNGIYYAGWKTTFTVTFDLNGGTGSFPPVSILDSGKVSKPTTDPTPMEGYMFKYWALSTDLTKEYVWTNSVTNNITLKAIWELLPSSTPGLAFSIINNNTAYEVSLGTANTNGTVVIPSNYNEKPVLSIAANAFYNCKSLKSIIIPYGITSIGNYAFYGCNSLTSITIPNSVNNIGNYAFRNCDKLTNITVPGSVNTIGKDAFSSCKGLKSVIIMNGVASIGDYAFYWCDELTSVEIPSTVTSIGTYAFYYSKKLVNVAFGSNSQLISIGYEAFGDTGLTSINIPNSVTTIGSYAFASCSGLTSITIPANVTSFGTAPFYGCSTLTSIIVTSGNLTYKSEGNCVIRISDNTLLFGCRNSTIPNYVTSIGDNAFSGCSELTTITIPSTVMSIGYSAFSGCSGLMNITIPSTISSIGFFAFSGCSKLTNLVMPASVTNIGTGTFSGCSGLTSLTIPNGVLSIGNSTFSDCSKLTNLIIPASVISIGTSAFSGCSALTSLSVASGNLTYKSDANCVIQISNSSLALGIKTSIIPNYVTSIGSYAFSGCNSLTSITIPNNVISIDSFAFVNSGLTSITIGSGVLNIGDWAFSDCKSLMSITIGSGLINIGNHAFNYCTSLMEVIIDSNNQLACIGDNAFYYCEYLSSITIPVSVEYIGSFAFAECYSLTIYTDLISQPDEWSYDWNPLNRPVYWGGSSGGLSGTVTYADPYWICAEGYGFYMNPEYMGMHPYIIDIQLIIYSGSSFSFEAYYINSYFYTDYYYSSLEVTAYGMMNIGGYYTDATVRFSASGQVDGMTGFSLDIYANSDYFMRYSDVEYEDIGIILTCAYWGIL